MPVFVPGPLPGESGRVGKYTDICTFMNIYAYNLQDEPYDVPAIPILHVLTPSDPKPSHPSPASQCSGDSLK